MKIDMVEKLENISDLSFFFVVVKLNSRLKKKETKKFDLNPSQNTRIKKLNQQNKHIEKENSNLFNFKTFCFCVYPNIHHLFI